MLRYWLLFSSFTLKLSVTSLLKSPWKNSTVYWSNQKQVLLCFWGLFTFRSPPRIGKRPLSSQNGATCCAHHRCKNRATFLHFNCVHFRFLHRHCAHSKGNMSALLFTGNTHFRDLLKISDDILRAFMYFHSDSASKTIQGLKRERGLSIKVQFYILRTN